MTTLEQFTERKQQQARTAFIGAVWAGETSDRLAELASASGLEPAAADAIIARIAEARGDVAASADIIQLRRTESKAKAHFDTTRARTAAAIEKLEAETESAAIDADAAQRALRVADEAAMRVLAVYDQGLLPAARLPKEVLSLIEGRARDRKADEAHAAMVAAADRRNRLRDRVENLKAQLRDLPLSRDYEQQKAQLEAKLKRASADLAGA